MLQELAQDLLKQAKLLGASDAEISLGISRGYSVTVRHAQPANVEHNSDKGLSISVYFGKRVGNASTTDFSKEALKLSLEKACYIARYINEDPYAGLADPELMAYNYQNLDLQLFHPWNISIAQAIKIATKCEAAGLAYDKKIIKSDGTVVNNAQSFSLYANTYGFSGYKKTTVHDMSCVLIAAEKAGRGKKYHGKQGKMQRDGDYTLARNPALLLNAKALGESAARLALRRLGARHITTRTCPVIFEAPIAKSLISILLSAVSGGNLYNRTSFLCDCLDKKVIAPHLTIDENPHVPQAIGSSPYDQEGVQNKQQLIVSDGTLVRYILGSYTARKLNMKTTGNAGGCYNIFVKTSNHDLSFADLLKEMQTGLLVTELMGSGVNMVTGDYSCGAFGFWVENGIIQHPVDGITIAGNLKDMLHNIVTMSNDIDKRSVIFTGSLLISNMQVGGANSE